MNRFELMMHGLRGQFAAGRWTCMGETFEVWQRSPATVPCRMVARIVPGSEAMWAEAFRVELGGVVPSVGWWWLAASPPADGSALDHALRTHAGRAADVVRMRLAERARPVASLEEGKHHEDERLRALGVTLEGS